LINKERLGKTFSLSPALPLHPTSIIRKAEAKATYKYREGFIKPSLYFRESD